MRNTTPDDVPKVIRTLVSVLRVAAESHGKGHRTSASVDYEEAHLLNEIKRLAFSGSPTTENGGSK